MEGAMRLINAYDTNKKRSFCGFCRGDKKKLFHGRWLKVEQAVEPGLISWHNLGLSHRARCLYTSVFTMVSLLLLLITTGIIVLASNEQKQLLSVELTCDAESQITKEAAFVDYQATPED